ncbi:MAG: ComF family protein [Planctomycetia bacterium]|nr:ComF family protein [Planctomycetia bacterium]
MVSWAHDWGRLVFRWIGDGADLLLPRSCRLCRAEGDLPGHGFCAECARELVVDGARCPRCGEPAAAAVPTCPACRRSPTPWAGLVFLGGYDGRLREAILRIKRPGAEDLAQGLGMLLVDKHRAALEAARCDAVVPVPMHWWRRATRGTSAAEEIARAVGRTLRLPVVSALVRARATPMQNALPPEDRPANVADAFRGRGGVSGRRVLLIDDVFTTGATLAACAASLRAAGAAATFGAAVARADRLADDGRRGGP